jgi:hypothetical protein
VTQGWKLHISARPSSLTATLDAVLPVLLTAGCDFKIISSVAVLREFNDGLHGMAAVGKAVTVYPRQDRFDQVARRLADKLSGFDAPRINSDRKLRDDAPVYYRFGPFSAVLRYDELGYIDATLEDPHGERVSGRAGQVYQAPRWVRDPVAGPAVVGVRLPRVDGEPVIGDRYRIVSAITRTFRGTIFRAVDIRTGGSVIVKEAAAFVNETDAGDARSYLRSELEALDALAGVAGVPTVIDYFAYGPDEYLVTSQLGPIDLRNDVIDHGLFTWKRRGARCILVVMKSILDVLDAIHRRGIVFRDLAPKNVVRMAGGGWGLVDFELASVDGNYLRGWTPGYSCSGQIRNQLPSPSDDYYSLGATMFYAVTGMDPVVVDRDPGVNVARTIDCLDAVVGRACPSLVDIVGDLLSADVSRRCDAAEWLRSARELSSGVVAKQKRRAVPSVEVLLGHTLDRVVVAATELEEAIRGGFFPPVNVQVGTAGVIAELALHSRGVQRATELARLTADIVERVDAPLGLLYGRMGVSMAIQAAAVATGADELHDRARKLLPTSTEIAAETRFDVAQGVAGLGIGYLAFAALAREPDRVLALATECAWRIRRSADEIDVELQQLPVGTPGQAISISDGFAHGRAGIAYFLLAHAAHTGDLESAGRARQMLEALSQEVPRLALRARSATARPMSASWCQGLAGIGSTLARGAYFFGDETFEAAARTAAAACVDISSRVPLVTQCCGLAGVGEFFLDMALLTGESRYKDNALETLTFILARAGGTAAAPRFPGSDLRDEAAGWGMGIAGVLAFLRRLAEPATHRSCLADGRRLLPAQV